MADPTPPVADDKIIQDANLFRALYKSPKHRAALQAIIKTEYPETEIPEHDIRTEFDARVDARVAPVLEENKALVAKVETMEKFIQRSVFAQGQGLEEDELADVEAFAKENGIVKADKAVELWRSQMSLGRPRSTARTDAEQEYSKTVAKAARGGSNALKQAATKEADRVLREMRGGRVR